MGGKRIYFIFKLNNFKCPVCNSSNLRFTLEEGKFPSKESSTGFFTFLSYKEPLYCGTCETVFESIKDEEDNLIDLKVSSIPKYYFDIDSRGGYTIVDGKGHELVGLYTNNGFGGRE